MSHPEAVVPSNWQWFCDPEGMFCIAMPQHWQAVVRSKGCFGNVHAQIEFPYTNWWLSTFGPLPEDSAHVRVEVTPLVDDRHRRWIDANPPQGYVPLLTSKTRKAFGPDGEVAILTHDARFILASYYPGKPVQTNRLGGVGWPSISLTIEQVRAYRHLVEAVVASFRPLHDGLEKDESIPGTGQ
jgi:hypothetical protein